MPNGWLDPHDPGDIAVKMRRMLALAPDERQRLAEKNRQQARTFTWEKAARQMVGIFEAVAAKGAG